MVISKVASGIGRLVEPLANFLDELHPVPDLNSSLEGSWYLSPSQHVLEYLGMNAAFPWLFKSYLERSLQAGTHLEKVLHEKLPHAHVEPLMDKILLGLLIASLGLTVMHKTVRRSAIFLLQPCHVSALALIVLLRMDPTQERTHIAFNIYLHCMWGAALALFFPDLRDYNAFLEVENFWIEHILVVFLPFYWIYTGRFVLLPLNFDFGLASFFFNALYHSLVLNTVALALGKNMNYLLQPPPVGPMMAIGRWYRVAMYGFCCVLTFVDRWMVLELWHQVCRFLPQLPIDVVSAHVKRL